MEYLSEKELEDYKNASEVEKLRLVNLIAKNIIERKSNTYKCKNNLCESNESSISEGCSTLSFGDGTSSKLNLETEITDSVVEEDEPEEINCETFRVEDSGTTNRQHLLPQVDNNWGDDAGAMNQFGYVMEYLRKTNELITQTKELKQLSTSSTYQVVSSTSDLLKNTSLQRPTSPPLSSRPIDEDVAAHASRCFNYEAEEAELKTHRPCDPSSYDIDVFSPLQDEDDDDGPSMQCEDDLLVESKVSFENKIENIKKEIFRNLSASPPEPANLLLEASRVDEEPATSEIAAAASIPEPAGGNLNDLSILKLVCEMESLSHSIASTTTATMQVEADVIPKLELSELSSTVDDERSTCSEPNTVFDYPLNRPRADEEVAQERNQVDTHGAVDDNSVQLGTDKQIRRVKSAVRIPKQISLLSTSNHRLLKPNVRRPTTRTTRQLDAASSSVQNVEAASDLSNWLPNEIWLHIFSYLTRTDLCRVGLTCSRLYAIASDRTLWRRVHLRGMPLYDGLLQLVGARSPKHIKLERCNASGITNAGLRKLFHGCKNSLLSFAVDKCVGKQLAGDNIFLHLSCHCASLTSVSVPWTAVSNDGLTALVAAASCLCEIDISGNSLITDESFGPLIRQHASTLTSVNMEGCFNVSPYTILHLCREAQHLLKLNIALCSKISNDAAVQISSALTRLHCFDGHGVKAFDDRCLETLASNSPQLSTLILGNCSDVSDRGVSAFASHKLQHLDISNCTHVTDQSLMKLQTLELLHLDVSSTSISSSLVVWLATNASSLHTLKLSYCRDVNQLSLEGLVRWNRNLHSLHVYGCKQVRISILSKLSNCLIVEK